MKFMRGLGIFCVGLLAGVLGMYLWPDATVVETAAPEHRQSDGSIVLERAPNANAKPKNDVPAGGMAERSIRVDVQPQRVDCPICTVDLTLVRMPDDTRRVVASSPTGDVIGGLDVPILPIVLDHPKVWAAGALYNGRWGALVTRDISWLSVGAAITTEKDGGFAPWAVLALRF
jgi:hypothetical protein